MENEEKKGRLQGLRHSLHEVIFESDTTAGKVFDIALLILIALSVIAVVLESVGQIEARIGPQLRAAEWVFTIAMVLGYSLIIIPTGIFAGELIKKTHKQPGTQACPSCSLEGHDADAAFCKHCGTPLNNG